MNPSPNIFSMLLIAGPFIIMYQLGLLLIYLVNRTRTAEETGEPITPLIPEQFTDAMHMPEPVIQAAEQLAAAVATPFVAMTPDPIEQKSAPVVKKVRVISEFTSNPAPLQPAKKLQSSTSPPRAMRPAARVAQPTQRRVMDFQPITRRQSANGFVDSGMRARLYSN